MSGWVQVGVDQVTLDEAEKLARELSGPALQLNRARILRAAVVAGIEALRRDPSKLLAPAPNVPPR